MVLEVPIYDPLVLCLRLCGDIERHVKESHLVCVVRKRERTPHVTSAHGRQFIV